MYFGCFYVNLDLKLVSHSCVVRSVEMRKQEAARKLHVPSSTHIRWTRN